MKSKSVIYEKRQIEGRFNFAISLLTHEVQLPVTIRITKEISLSKVPCLEGQSGPPMLSDNSVESKLFKICLLKYLVSKYSQDDILAWISLLPFLSSMDQ